MQRRFGHVRLISTIALAVGFLASLVTIADYWQKRQSKVLVDAAPTFEVTPPFPTSPDPIADGFTPTPAPDDQAQTVYRTRTGERYHRADCQHVKGKAIPLTLAEAKERGLTPCKVCRPPM